MLAHMASSSGRAGSPRGAKASVPKARAASGGTSRIGTAGKPRATSGSRSSGSFARGAQCPRRGAGQGGRTGFSRSTSGGARESSGTARAGSRADKVAGAEGSSRRGWGTDNKTEPGAKPGALGGETRRRDRARPAARGFAQGGGRGFGGQAREAGSERSDQDRPRTRTSNAISGHPAAHVPSRRTGDATGSWVPPGDRRPPRQSVRRAAGETVRRNDGVASRSPGRGPPLGAAGQTRLVEAARYEACPRGRSNEAAGLQMSDGLQKTRRSSGERRAPGGTRGPRRLRAGTARHSSTRPPRCAVAEAARQPRSPCRKDLGAVAPGEGARRARRETPQFWAYLQHRLGRQIVFGATAADTGWVGKCNAPRRTRARV